MKVRERVLSVSQSHDTDLGLPGWTAPEVDPQEDHPWTDWQSGLAVPWVVSGYRPVITVGKFVYLIHWFTKEGDPLDWGYHSRPPQVIIHHSGYHFAVVRTSQTWRKVDARHEG